VKFLKVIPYLLGGIIIWGFGFADLEINHEGMGVKEVVVLVSFFLFMGWHAWNHGSGGSGGACGD
tara:strand:- start:369 stop:563 length:195 start_codon:yes stop_codon:yes gene_type:complete